VHIYALIGVPVSTSQAIVGAVLGVGILKGARTIDRKTLSRILFGWTGTPVISAALTYVLFQLFRLTGNL
jgi:PiT family inorganic phosphate transporter